MAKTLILKAPRGVVRAKRDLKDVVGKRLTTRPFGVRRRTLDAALVTKMVTEGRLRPVKDPERVMRFIASTEAVDRMGDVIVQNWVFDSFTKNPVILWNHDQNIPLGRSVGEEVVTDENDADFKEVGPYLALYVEFASKEHGDHVEPIYKMYRDGFLVGGSVGFVPLEVDECQDVQRRNSLGLGPQGVIYTKSELAEFTLCTVPANRDVIVTAMKSMSAAERAAVEPLFKAPVTRTVPSTKADPLPGAQGGEAAEKPASGKPAKPAPKVDAKPGEGTEAKPGYKELETVEELVHELVQTVDVPDALANDILGALEALEIALGFEGAEEEAGEKPAKTARKVVNSRMFRERPAVPVYRNVLGRGARSTPRTGAK